MRAAKWILIVFGVLATLVVAGILALTLFVDPNSFKDDIVDAVGRETGRTLQLDGDIDLAFFPWLALTTGTGSLSNPDGFAGAPFISWREARIRVRLVPLLRGRAVVDTVRIVGADVRLAQRADGRGNWQGWNSTNGAPQDNGVSGNGVIAGIELVDSLLVYGDESSDTEIELTDWNLVAGAIRPGEPVELETTFAVDSNDDFPAARLRIMGRYVPRRDATVVENFRLAGTLHASSFNVADLPVEVTVPIARLTTDRAVDVPLWRVQLGSLDLQGVVNGQLDGTAGWSGSLTLTTANLRQALAQFLIEAPATRDPTVLGAAEIKTTWSFEAGIVAAKPLQVALDDSALSGELRITLAKELLTEFLLTGDQITIDRYLPPVDAESEPFVLPTARLRAMQARGTLDFAEASLADARMKRVRIRLLLDDKGLHTRE
ncbi:MAG: AsmA family protein [Steroidobacteraceae bacterium]|nr:AsmA family protein [Steroidobacteraceae bacterium]